MKVDNPNAFRFLMQDEVYLLPGDKVATTANESAGEDLPAADPIPVHKTEPISGVEPGRLPVATPAIVAPATPALSLPIVNTAPATPAQSIKTPEPAFNYLGNNNKNFAILVNYAADEHIPVAHLTALESMLKRKELALDDVAILNMHQYQPMPMAKVAELLKPVKMVIMGKEALPQGIGNLPLNSPVQGKKTHVLYSFSFDEMMSSNENKKAFWDQMKTL